MKDVRIFLDRGNYRPGDTINGVVCFHLGKEKKLKRIRLRIDGRASVKCTQSDDGIKVGSALISTKEVYFEDNTVLVETDASNATLTVGQHSLPFKFHLPLGIPSSFEGTNGAVRYTFECSFVRPWKPAQTQKKAIFIQSDVRLSDSPYAPLSWRRDARKKLGGVACMPGIVYACLDIPHRGTIPGEKVPFGAKIVNNSKTKLSAVKFTLNMVVRYESNSDEEEMRSNTEVVKLNRIHKGSVGAGESAVWTDETLVVPLHLPASNLQHCSIINVGYFIEMCVQPTGPYPALRIPAKTPKKSSEFNVILGTEY